MKTRYICIISMVLALFLSLLLGGCSSGGEKSSQTAGAKSDQEKIYVIKVSNDGTLTNPKVIALLKWSEDVEKATNGKVKIEVYHSGQLYNDRDAINAVSMGNVDVALPPLSVISGIDPNGQIVELPSFYGISYEQYRKLMDGEFGKALAAKFEQKLDVKVLGYYFLGNYIYASNKKPILKPDDLAGQRIRIMGGPISEQNMKNIGGTPVVVPWTECYPSLQQGVIDAIETTMVGFNSIKGWEVGKYVTYSKHIKNGYIFMMNKKKYEEIPDDLRKIVLEQWAESRKFQDEVAVMEKEEEGKKNFESNGVKVYELTADQLAAFRAKIMPLEDKYIKDLQLDNNLIEIARKAIQ
jgi:C4-dicarboxylate-binding protein DctP